MRLLMRNLTRFEYLPWTGMETDLNDDGEHTGEFHPEYGDPIEYRGNISSPSGRVNQTFYGMDIRYTHTLVMENPKADIDEYGKIRWKGELYDIVAIRPSLNALAVALRKQTVAHDIPYEPDPEPEPEGETGETGTTDGEGE